MQKIVLAGRVAETERRPLMWRRWHAVCGIVYGLFRRDERGVVRPRRPLAAPWPRRAA